MNVNIGCICQWALKVIDAESDMCIPITEYVALKRYITVKYKFLFP